MRREREETPEEGEQVQRAAVDAVTALFLLRHHYGVDAFSATIREIEALGEMHTSILSNAMEALMEDYIKEDDDARW